MKLSARTLLPLLMVLTSGCATRGGPADSAAPSPAAGGLPPVPERLGELVIDVVYPPEDASIAVRDSTFIFGNVGRGDATLSINGAPVEVAPNGGWLAFLSVPPNGVYDLVATADGRSATATRSVRVPPPPAAPVTDELRIVEGSVVPSGAVTVVRGETIEVSFRGTPGAVATLSLSDGTTIPMVEREAIERVAGFMLDESSARSGVSEYVGLLEVDTPIAPAEEPGDTPSLVAGGPVGSGAGPALSARIELRGPGGEVQRPLDLHIGVLDPARPRVAVAATDRPDGTVIGRRLPGGDQEWDFFWPNGTLLTIDGERQGYYRVRLTPTLSAWVSPGDVTLLAPGTPPPDGWVGPSIQLTPRERWTEARFSMSERLPFRVVPSAEGLSVEFYGAIGRPAYFGYGADDPFVDFVDWNQDSDDLFRFDVQLSRPLWGYRYRWEGSTLILEIREPPTIEPAEPLRGLTIAVDAGHRGSPGDVGAVGPTRLTEAEANLSVARRIAAILRERGVNVVEIRPDSGVVPLIDRPIIAERENADLFFSVHFNAFPDGVDPFANHGTTMFYFWPHSVELARHFQREILREVGLPDRGVRYQNLAITRTPWMPAVLTETLYLMFPRQEAALRDPNFVERIAEAHVRAMESFVRERAAVAAEGGPRGR